MATAANSCLGSGRVGWVEFAEDTLGNNNARHQTAADQLLESNSAPPESNSAPPDVSSECSALPTQQNAWVLFEESPWPPPATQAQVKAARHSICSTASFWSTAPPSGSSWTSQSEQSFVSNGTSSCDLNSVEAGNKEPADMQTHYSYVFADDEGVDMDSISSGSGSRQINSQRNHVPLSCNSSWVTFEDGGKPTPQNQDDNSHQMAAPAWNESQNGGLLDFTPDGLGFRPLLQSSTFYTKKNPFFNDEFSDIKPSAINPFSSFFDTGQKRWSQPDGPASDLSSDLVSKDSQSTLGSCLNVIQLQRPGFGERGRGGEGEGGEVFQDSPPTNKLAELQHLRKLQIVDPDDPGSPALPEDLLDEGHCEQEEAQESPDRLYWPRHMAPEEGWPMLLRIPEKKNIMSSRHWGPIYVRLSDEGLLQLFYEKGLEKPFRTLRLQPQHEVTEHRLQSYEDTGRVHTISVELVQYRERRRIQPKTAVTHQPVREQLVKLATSCYPDYLSFRHSLAQLLRRLPSGAAAAGALGSPSPVTPTMGGVPCDEEIQVEVRDEFYGAVAEGDGKILKQLVITRVNVLAFLSGLPRCQMGLNDIQVKGKEMVSRHDIIPNTTTRWIRLCDPELHGDHADELEFLSSRGVVFTPPPRRRFQLLRFHTPFAEKTLPFTLRTVASVNGAEVTVQSWLLMSQGFSPNRDTLNIIPCENVAIRYPIPETWAKNFRREGVIGEKSLKARFNKGASFGTASTSGSEPAMRVTLGTAKYEQAFKALVWRIARLPDKNSGLGHPHTFFCRLELGSDQDVPKSLERHLEVEFDMPAASASKATVRSLSVGDRPDVKKWINYKSHFFYQVPIEQKRECATDTANMHTDSPGECAHQ